MNIKRAKEEIKNTIEAYLQKDAYGAYEIPSIRQRPVLLIGPPGIGKTQIMEQIAQECRIGLVSYTITHHTRQSAIGLPYIQEKIFNNRRCSVTEYTMSEIVASVYEKMEDTGLREGILFIDEINCVSETLAPAMLQFLQCKTFGNHKIPEGWVIVAAGNPPEYNKSVREFDVVTLDRIKMIPVEADFAVWKEYAEAVRIHPAILSYLSLKTQNFCRIETTVDGRRFATPRGWEDLSRFIEVYEKLGKTVDREVVFQYIQHETIAKDFANYLELYHKYKQDYETEEILEGRIREGVYEKLEKAPFDERLSVVSLLLDGIQAGFWQLDAKAERMRRLQKLFEGLRPGSAGADGYESAAARLEGIAAGVEADWKYRRESGLLSRSEDRMYQDLGHLLNDTAQQARALHLTEPEEVWQHVNGVFQKESEAYDALFDRCAARLEHGFDFMEGAFGNSQEMAVFVTGLNTSRCSTDFLRQYSCERYFQYNRMLLFDDREQEILSRIPE